MTARTATEVTQFNVALQTLAVMRSKVSVTWTTERSVTCGFHTAISVTGELQAHPTDGSFRVLVTPETYCYFRADNVYLMAPYTGGNRICIEAV